VAVSGGGQVVERLHGLVGDAVVEGLRSSGRALGTARCSIGAAAVALNSYLQRRDNPRQNPPAIQQEQKPLLTETLSVLVEISCGRILVSSKLLHWLCHWDSMMTSASALRSRRGLGRLSQYRELTPASSSLPPVQAPVIHRERLAFR
jgi:hypothetical protein